MDFIDYIDSFIYVDSISGENWIIFQSDLEILINKN